MQVKKQQLEPDIEQQTSSKLGKEYVKGVYCHPAYVYMLSTSCEMPGRMKHKLESRFPGKIQSSQICRWYYPNCRKQRGTKEPLDEGEREEQRSWLKTQHQTTKITASSPITSWQISSVQFSHSVMSDSATGQNWLRWEWYTIDRIHLKCRIC